MSTFKISYGSTKVGQFDLPDTAPDIGGTLQRKADAPLKPAKPQVACDHGLFGDSAAQLDLIHSLAQESKP
jgi:hypothetical protein